MGPLEPIVELMVSGILKFVLWVVVPLLIITIAFGKVIFRLPKPLQAIIYLGVGYGCWFIFAKYGV
jgi:hypothetical protein